MNPPIPLQWVGLIALPTLFTVMFAIGLMLGPAQVAAAMTRRTILLAVLFAAVVPLPVVTVVAVQLFDLRGPIGVGLLLMAISPGAPFALRRAIDAGGHRDFAPALHIAIVALAVVTVPLSVAILDALFSANFQVTYLQIGKQVFFAQLLPLLLGALVRYLKPGLAIKIEPRAARLGNGLVAVFTVVLLIDVVPIVASIGHVQSWACAGDRRGQPRAARGVGSDSGRHGGCCAGGVRPSGVETAPDACDGPVMISRSNARGCAFPWPIRQRIGLTKDKAWQTLLQSQFLSSNVPGIVVNQP